MKLIYSLSLLILLSAALPVWADHQLCDHPRILINKELLPVLAERARGTGIPADDYASIKAEADRMVAEGTFRNIANKYLRPTGIFCTALAYLVERELGNEQADSYAEAVKKLWGNGLQLSNLGSGHFGSYAICYDWIYDYLTPEERTKFGNYLAVWLSHYTSTPEIILKWGHFLYNQTWGPMHLSTPHCRDGITPKLFVALALSGAGTSKEDACKRNLDSFAARIPADCIPLFDIMGGVWSESMGHGGYGPNSVIPWAFEAWRTATGENYFTLGSPTSFVREMNMWGVHTTVPFSGRTAYIDDNISGNLLTEEWCMLGGILGARYNDPVANYISASYDAGAWPDNMWKVPWMRFIIYDPDLPSKSPGRAGLPFARLFTGAGHVYMRSAWDDPDATWAFLGAGPKFAGHSRDDEGHFMIAKKGWLILRAGGKGGNNDDYYAKGSINFNMATIFDPNENFNHISPSGSYLTGGGTKRERDGGIIRADPIIRNDDPRENIEKLDLKHRGY
ncbi:MAG: hypothetical protein U9N45_01735, partial [Gemmatimonadota bacterium]|nr:hypothetical protein [Gemmatimonadota bacterium]